MSSELFAHAAQNRRVAKILIGILLLLVAITIVTVLMKN